MQSVFKVTTRLTLHRRRVQVWPSGSLSSERCRTTHSWASRGKGFLLQEELKSHCEKIDDNTVRDGRMSEMTGKFYEIQTFSNFDTQID